MMSFINPQDQADALDDYLRGASPADPSALPQEEARLANAIRQEAKTWNASPDFQQDLEEKLRALHARQKPAFWQALGSLFRPLAWGGVALLFVWAMSWTIQNLLPAPPTQPASLVQATATEMPTPTPTPLVVMLEPTLAPNAVRSPLFPDRQFLLQADFPPAPTSVNVYIQQPEQTIDIETARQIAAQLGINGHVYRPLQSESGQEYLIVSDGVSRVFFNSNRRFYYIADYSRQLSRQGEPPDAETARQVALEFLQAHGLLNLPYRFEAAVGRLPGTVQLVWLLDERPVHYSGLDAFSVFVEVGSDLQVKTVEYNRLEMEKVDEFPIISAEQAWQILLSAYPSQGIEDYSGYGPTYTSNPQSWQRDYLLDTPLEVYGWLEMLRPAEAGIPPLFTLNNITLQGNLQNLEALANPGKLIKVKGVFHQDERGGLILEVESAAETDTEWYSLSGELRQENGQVYIVNDSQKVRLLNPPANLPIGSQADAGGILQDKQNHLLEWYWLNSGYGGGGGGGGGSSFPFRELNLSGDRSGLPTPTPIPVLAPTPQAGTRLEGESGILSMSIRQFSDGRQVTETYWWMEPNEKFPDGLSLMLFGNLQGLEAYNQYPIRIWGTLEDNTQQPYRCNVERYELTYPGLQPQTWIGTEQAATVEGKQVLLFTDQDGKQYVLKSSIDYDPDNLLGAAGDLIEITGFVYPDSNFGGYAVIREVSAGNVRDLNSSAPDQAGEGNNPFEIPIISEPGPIQGSDVATIENIELVYYTADLRFLPGVENNPPFYIQPVWRFSGHYQNGTAFEILVQALAEQYLK